MPKFNIQLPNLDRRSWIALIVMVILLISIPLGMYLIKNPQIFKPRAAVTSVLPYRANITSSDGNSQVTASRNVKLNLDYVTGLSNPPSNTEQTVKVLVLNFFPTITQNGGEYIDPSITNVTTEQGNPVPYSVINEKVGVLTNQLTSNLTEATKYHGYKSPTNKPSITYKILDTKTYKEAIPPAEEKIPCFETNSETAGAEEQTCDPTRGWGTCSTDSLLPPCGENTKCIASYRPDYKKLLERENICHQVDDLGVRQVWLWGYHNFRGSVVPVESAMSMGTISRAYWNHGTYGNISQTEDISTLPVCKHTYTIFNYNYDRGLGEAMEDHGHQIENVLNYVDTNLWTSFIRPNGDTDKVNHCGWVHSPPNVDDCHEYDWNSKANFESDCQDWKPDGSGQKEVINCSAWYNSPDCPNDGGVSFKRWWMQNIPGRLNNLSLNGQQLRNWWDFYADFDAAMASGYKSLVGGSEVNIFRVANSYDGLEEAQEHIFSQDDQTIDWILSQGEGEKSVFVQFKDGSGNWEYPRELEIDFRHKGETSPYCKQLSINKFGPEEIETVISGKQIQLKTSKSVRFVAKIVNDNARRDNIQWLVDGNIFSIKDWDYAGWKVPSKANVKHTITMLIDDKPQADCSVVVTSGIDDQILSSPYSNPSPTPTAFPSPTPIPSPSTSTLQVKEIIFIGGAKMYGINGGSLSCSRPGIAISQCVTRSFGKNELCSNNGVEEFIPVFYSNNTTKLLKVKFKGTSSLCPGGAQSQVRDNNISLNAPVCDFVYNNITNTGYVNLTWNSPNKTAFNVSIKNKTTGQQLFEVKGTYLKSYTPERYVARNEYEYKVVGFTSYNQANGQPADPVEVTGTYICPAGASPLPAATQTTAPPVAAGAPAQPELISASCNRNTLALSWKKSAGAERYQMRGGPILPGFNDYSPSTAIGKVWYNDDQEVDKSTDRHLITNSEGDGVQCVGEVCSYFESGLTQNSKYKVWTNAVIGSGSSKKASPNTYFPGLVECKEEEFGFGNPKPAKPTSATASCSNKVVRVSVTNSSPNMKNHVRGFNVDDLPDDNQRKKYYPPKNWTDGVPAGKRLTSNEQCSGTTCQYTLDASIAGKYRVWVDNYVPGTNDIKDDACEDDTLCSDNYYIEGFIDCSATSQAQSVIIGGQNLDLTSQTPLSLHLTPDPTSKQALVTVMIDGVATSIKFIYAAPQPSPSPTPVVFSNDDLAVICMRPRQGYVFQDVELIVKKPAERYGLEVAKQPLPAGAYCNDLNSNKLCFDSTTPSTTASDYLGQSSYWHVKFSVDNNKDYKAYGEIFEKDTQSQRLQRRNYELSFNCPS